MKTTWQTTLRLIKEMNNYDYMKIIQRLIKEYFSVHLEDTDLKNTNAMYEDEEDNIVTKFIYKSNPQSVFEWHCHFIFDTTNSTIKYKYFYIRRIPGRADSFSKKTGETVEGFEKCKDNKFIRVLGDIKNQIISTENKLF
jgi:hypothetical protein